jgi:DNA-binding ferritin-like protein (Dps family)
VGETFTSSEKFTYGLSTILGGRGGADPYGGERAKQAAENKAYADKVKAEAAAKGVTAAPGAGGTDSASADVRLKDAQNTIKQTYNSFFEDQDRLNALAGRNQTGLITQNLLEVAQAFNKVKSTLTGDDQLEFEKKFFGPLNSQLEGLRNTVLGAGNELSNLQPGLIGQKNPYVHFFTDAEEAARRFHNTYDIVGHGFADSLISANNAQINTEKYQQRITDAFKATELEFEAAKLAQPFRELTLVMQNSKAVFDADFKAATENPLLRREAQELEQGYKVPRYQAGQQDQANLARLVSDPRAAGSDRGSRAIRSEIDKYVLGLTQGARPEDRNSTDPALRYRAQQRARALRDTAEENDAAIQDAIAKVQINNYGVNLAQGKLAELNSLSRNAPGEARNITRGAFLQATDSLPREALTPELLKGRIGALQEEAQYRRSQEKLAAEAAEATKKLQQYLVGEGGNGGLLTQLLNAVMSGNNKLLLEIIRKADTVDVSATLQNSPSAKPSGEYTPTAADRQALSGSTF